MDDVGETRGHARSGMLVAAGVAALAVLALVAVVLQQTPPQLDPDTTTPAG